MSGKILQKDAPVLREVAKPVPVDEIDSDKVKDIIERMRQAVYGEDDGVAIAAPQIGESVRIFMVKGEALNLLNKKKKTSKSKVDDLIYINPEITKISKRKRWMEEGCLSVRWLYGEVERSEKVTLKAFDPSGKAVERIATGLLAQIFQHEMDHLEGKLFIDRAENLRDLPPPPKFVFFGSSEFSNFLLDELQTLGLTPALHINNAREDLPLEKLREVNADVFVVASFGKILAKEIIEMPKHGTLNVHPSLLPELRGASPIQNTILGKGRPGITIIKMDEKMDHGPIVAQIPTPILPWPDRYEIVEEKLARIGGRILAEVIPRWVKGQLDTTQQDDTQATFTKLIQKEDGLLDLNDSAELNWRKVLAFSRWPGAYLIHKRKDGKEIRVVVKDATVENGIFKPLIVIPAGKREMNWQDFLRGN